MRVREWKTITSFKYVRLLKGCNNLVLLPAEVDYQRDWLRKLQGWFRLGIKSNCLAIMIVIDCLCWQAVNQYWFSRTDWMNIYQKRCRRSNPASETRDLGWKLNFVIFFLYLSPQKCIVGMPHTFPRKSKLFPTNLSVLQIVTSPQIQCGFPLYPQPPAKLSLHPPFLTSLHCREEWRGW